MYATEKMLNEHGDKVDPASRSAVEGAVDRLREALKGDDTAAIEAAVNEVNAASQKLGVAMYQAAAAQQGAQAGPQPGPEAHPGGQADSDTVDADFSVVGDEEDRK